MNKYGRKFGAYTTIAAAQIIFTYKGHKYDFIQDKYFRTEDNIHSLYTALDKWLRFKSENLFIQREKLEI